VVKCLPSKPKALGSVLSSGKKKKKKWAMQQLGFLWSLVGLA
jgi:hypothetical protein